MVKVEVEVEVVMTKSLPVEGKDEVSFRKRSENCVLCLVLAGDANPTQGSVAECLQLTDLWGTQSDGPPAIFHRLPQSLCIQVQYSRRTVLTVGGSARDQQQVPSAVPPYRKSQHSSPAD